MITKNKTLIGCNALLILLSTVCYSQTSSPNNLQLLKTNGHAMQYYVSLPENWASTKKWPLVIILEAAEKEYKANAERFAAARGKLPFIIVAPIHTSNGNYGRRDPKLFPYSNETWDYIDKIGDCQFNEDGIKQILIDIKEKFSAEEKVYLTGFEAGTHLLWSFTFNHPEYLKAVAAVAGNYRGRCVDVKNISKAPAKSEIFIMSFAGMKDEYFGPKGGNFNQWIEAKNIATANGFKNVGETIIDDKGHEPMPNEALAYFFQIYTKEGR
jgi:poly(3-hydroxybutyrate) depolymerase